MNRFTELKSSKFERLSQAELSSVKGGCICISCLKRTRKIRVGFFVKAENGTISGGISGSF
jgi:hypothetical protein